MLDVQKVAETVLGVVKTYVDKALLSLTERINTLEERESPRGEKGDTGDRGADGLPGHDGAEGKSGVGVAGALIDRSGNLILTLSDGTNANLGLVVGHDGTPGEKGVDGTNGADGLGFEDMTEELADDGRTIIRTYRRGDVVKEFRHKLSVVLDRGVFKEGQAYQSGDAVSWGGSMWIAQDDTTDKPETSKAWRLAVKRGRDGKDGKPGERGLPGKEGPQGKRGGEW